MAEPLLARIACPSLEEARRIGRALIEHRLAACVHLIPHEAIYRWNGAIETAAEITLLAKTTQSAFPRLCAQVLQAHSHQLPAITATPITHGHAPFLEWIEQECAD
jgi:periplasmic divalent cation tolerance protein